MRIINSKSTVLTPHHFAERNVEMASRNAYMSHAKSGCGEPECRVPELHMPTAGDSKCENTRCMYHTGYNLLKNVIWKRTHTAMFEFAPLAFTMRADACGPIEECMSTGLFPAIRMEPIHSEGTVLISGNFRSVDKLARVVTPMTHDPGLLAALRAVAPVLFEIVGHQTPEHDGSFVSSYDPFKPIPFSQDPDEHQFLTANFVTNRGITHELVRHRPASFAQRSTRYVDEGKCGMEFILPYDAPEELLGEWNRDKVDMVYQYGGMSAIDHLHSSWLNFCMSTEEEYNFLRSQHYKWAAQKARGVLTNDLRADITMMTTISHWRFLASLRTAPDAHPQIQDIIKPIIEHIDAM